MASPVDWDIVLNVREVVAKELEALRGAGKIGAPLDAQVEVHGGESLAAMLAALQEELRFLFITSAATVVVHQAPASGAHGQLPSGEDFWVVAEPAAAPKCVRCWHRRDDVGSHGEHPELCGRCVANVAGEGETRRFA